MQSTFNISPEILNWVIAHIQNDSVPPTVTQYIQQWQAGEKLPTYNQIEMVGRATGIPLGYFFLKKPPQEDLSLLDCRTIDSLDLKNPSRNLVDTIHDMENIQGWVRDYLLSENSQPLQFVGSWHEPNDINSFAENIRKAINLKINWFETYDNADESFRQIRLRISNIGVFVMMSGIVENNTHRALDINEFRAFTLVDDLAPLIFINACDSANGRLFSLLHELAHIWIGQNDFFNDRYSAELKVSKTETICNAVAAEILVPQTTFKNQWQCAKEKSFDECVASLAKYFKCGYTVIARKAFDNGLISDAQYKSIAKAAVDKYKELQLFKKERASGGDFYKTVASRIDQRFFNMLYNSVIEGKTLYTDAFRLTNTNRTTFMTLAEKVRGDEQ